MPLQIDTPNPNPPVARGLAAGARATPSALQDFSSSQARKPSALVPGAVDVQTVASFEHQVTGVTVSADGRIFVNFPRWTEDTPVSVAEVLEDGSIRPYPDAGWNAWRNALANLLPPESHFVCVQSVVADGRGNLWVLDPAAPAQNRLLAGGVKMVRIALATNQVAQTIVFDATAAPQGSYLNDLRFSPDGGHAYITDSGARGALLVVELATGRARRVLDGHPSTQVERDVVIRTDGRELRQTDGRGAAFAADGIALSPDGAHLYWQALTGRTLYRIAASALRDASLGPAQLAAAVETVGENGPSDGLWIDAAGRMYISAMQDDAVKVRDGEVVTTLVSDPLLRWPDTFAEGPDGTVYVTASRIMDMAWFKPETGPRLPTRLLKLTRRL